MNSEYGPVHDEIAERYKSVVAAMAEGVILQDAGAVILACNEAAEQLLGLSADQMMGRSSLDPRWRAMHEDGSPFPGDTHPVPVTLRTGKPQRDVVMGVHKPDGSLTWLSINSEPLFRPGETTPYAAVCTFSDITRRKHVEDALRASEERYRRILETTLEGVWMIELAGKTLYGNQRMAEMLACTVEELAASNVWDFVDDADKELVQKRLAARGRGIAEVHEFRLRRKDGSFIWTSMATSPITHPDGTKGALAMVRDITVQRQMEAQLRESKERLELALSAGHMGTWGWTVDTGVCEGSRELREILGLPPDAPLDTPDAFWATVHPDDRPVLEAKMREYLSKSSTAHFNNDFRVVRLDGSVRWVRSSGAMMLMPSGHKRVLGTVVDFTDSRALEEQLQQARHLESIGRLAGGVAHDFNNLLTAILASATFAQRIGAPGIEDELATICTAAERGAELTRQLLAYARKQVIQLASLDLNALVDKLSGVLRRIVGEDITLTFELADELWSIRAGASQVEQVIVNLVVNAREAMPDGGPVRVATRNVTIDGHDPSGLPPGDYVMLAITDRGLGIDRAALPHIFEPFYSTKRTGTGLGLASSYGIVTQLGGQISVRTDSGAGSTFSVYLPREQATSAAVTEPTTRRTVPRGSASTLMLVEDDELLRRVIARGLGDLGYRVIVAGDGEQAVALAAAHEGPIDVLVTDVIMPKMSGRQLADRFAEVRPQTRILFVSGYTDQIIARQGVLEPGQHFLAKPYTLDALAQRIHELLGQVERLAPVG